MTLSLQRHRLLITLSSLVIVASVLLYSCKKDDVPRHHPSSYPSTVLDKWITMQLRLMRNATGIANHAFSRHFAYSGIAAVEALDPGLYGRRELSDKWNGLTGLPVANRSQTYYYPANVNAAMASINRLMFPNANATDKAAIDSLETALTNEFLANQPAGRITLSANFGKAVAQAVFNWSETDGYKNANAPYTLPTGPGIWKPTAANAVPATPYWGNNRPVITGSLQNTEPPAPLTYSTATNSPFYTAAKEVYDVSATLTDDQKAMAAFWRDIPGVSSPGHWLSVLQQLIKKKSKSLDEVAIAYALTGAAVNDALIACFKAKYQHLVVRPVTYIREIMEQGAWSPFLNTPMHPEYPSAHSSLSMAGAKVLEKIFGNTSLTDHTYDYMGMAPRNYNSITAIATEAGQSRLYAGIHYTFSINAGLTQGSKVAENILRR